MNKLLPIGSVVQLHHGERKIMILNRYPLDNNQGEIGYFDYSACLYPQGHTDNQVYFFNHENIDTVWFEGYVDDSEEEIQELYRSKQDRIPYPRLTLEENNE